MTLNRYLALPTLALMLIAGAAGADSNHAQQCSDGPGAGRDHGMTQLMSPMHGMMRQGSMMGEGVMGVGGAMQGMVMSGLPMMKMLDEDEDGAVTPEEARASLGDLLSDYDGDGDGTLSIGEFEALHSALIREAMVDRFQHLDADGDGQITEEEMAAPADRIERMQAMHERMMEESVANMPGGMMNGQGSKIEDEDSMMPSRQGN